MLLVYNPVCDAFNRENSNKFTLIFHYHIRKFSVLFDDYDMHNYTVSSFDLNLIYYYDKNIQGIDRRYMKCKCANKIHHYFLIRFL